MNGQIAQMVALTCHANAHFQGWKVGSFFPNNSTCQFCGDIRFFRFDNRDLAQYTEAVIAENPEQWMEKLLEIGCHGLRLHWRPTESPKQPDRYLAAFIGGGGTWAIQAIHGVNMADYWYSRWKVGDKDAPDKRIWKVSYGAGQNKAYYPASTRPDIGSRKKMLESALRDIREFSKGRNLGHFTDSFSKALESLDTPEVSRQAFYQDLVPKDLLPEQAVRILNSCQFAWVFGGMGSWNDMTFEGDTQKAYDRVSENLFQALVQTIADCASESFFSGRS